MSTNSKSVTAKVVLRVRTGKWTIPQFNGFFLAEFRSLTNGVMNTSYCVDGSVCHLIFLKVVRAHNVKWAIFAQFC